MSSRLYQSKSWFWEYVCTTRPDSIISFSRPLFFADCQCFCHVAFAVNNCDSFVRVSMGLTDRRKTAKNLADSRKN